MPVRKAEARWEGSLKGGRGTVRLGSGAFEGAYSFSSRFEEGTGTNPEELVGAAHAGCYSMALSADLERAGFPPTSVETTAKVRFEKLDAGWRITEITLVSRAVVPGIDEETFMEVAQGAKTGCPISNALKAVEITLDATLVS
jgi:osmotically inducible protein OsmC